MAEGFEITVPRGPMVCGYCGETEWWSHIQPAPAWLQLGYLSLTGFHSIGVGPAGELVVLVECEHMNGRVDHLPHLCAAIPDSVREQYADDIGEIIKARVDA